MGVTLPLLLQSPLPKAACAAILESTDKPQPPVPTEVTPNAMIR